jgi:hypothetical protein
VEALPYLLAIFEQDKTTYSKDAVECIAEKWRGGCMPEAYSKAVSYLLGLQKYESDMAQALKPIKYKPEQEKSGIKEFEVFGEYNTYNSLAEGSLLKHKEVLSMTLAEVSVAIRYANLKTWYETNIHENHLADLRAKQKK